MKRVWAIVLAFLLVVGMITSLEVLASILSYKYIMGTVTVVAGDGNATLWLYVNTSDRSKTEWTAFGSPYTDTLNDIDYPNYYIRTGDENKTDGDYYFTDSGKSTETITNVTTQIYGIHNSTNKELEVFVWNGSSWTSLGPQTLPTSWAWVNYTATTVLDTWAKIDEAKIYVRSSDSGDYYHVDCARLQVNYNSTS